MDEDSSPDDLRAGGGRRRGSAACSVPDSARRIVDQGRSSPGSRSLPFFDRSGSVHAERLKQQGRLFPPFIFEMLTSTRRLRVSGFLVELTQRTHSQRAIGVISFHRLWIFGGAAARAVARSWGTPGSDRSVDGHLPARGQILARRLRQPQHRRGADRGQRGIEANGRSLGALSHCRLSSCVPDTAPDGDTVIECVTVDTLPREFPDAGP